MGLAGCGSSAVKPQTQEEALDQAKRLVVKGQWEQALALYDGLVRRNPTLAVAWSDRAYIHCVRGDHTQAAADARRAIELDRTLAEAHANLGLAIDRMGGRGSEAITALEKAIRLDPGLAEAHCTLGTIQYRRRKLDAARQHLQAAVGLNSRLAEAHYNLALVWEALARRKSARHQLEAKDERRQALRSFRQFLALGVGPEDKKVRAEQSVRRLQDGLGAGLPTPGPRDDGGMPLRST